jgi:GT2 family glycosyltransferase
MKPTLCILNFNGADVLPVALRAACGISDRFAEIVVVDNASEDISVELIESQFPDVRVLLQDRNLGAAGGRNAGLEQLAADLILFIDNDVALTANCVDELVAALSARPDASIAVPAVIYADDRDRVQYGGAAYHFLGLQVLENEDVPLSAIDPRIHDMGSLVSCAFLIDKSRLPDREFFDESFFIYFEDHEFGVRMRVLGSHLLIVPTAQCFHGKGTEGLSIRQLGSYSSRRVFFLIRNRWLFILKMYSLRSLIVLAPVFVCYEAAQLLTVIKKGWLREWWRSVVWVIRNLPEVLRERRRIQRLRRVADRELMIGGRLPYRSELTTSRLERLARSVLDRVCNSYWRVASRLI